MATETKPTQQAVLTALDRFLDAAMKGDVAGLDSLLDKDFTYTHASNAQIDARDVWLKIYDPASPTYRVYRVYAVRELLVRMFPGAAVITGTGHQEIVRPNGDEVDLNSTFTCTWIEEAGQWRIVAWQATRILDS
jgi:hypothetical protein